ncbi:hypothetical protein [Nocardioides jiangxiensis]|uniref:Tight adherence protein B n=1 Tax=Nocardioides jiangxiensis TaxID=3064524 RepID=A0ABT9AYF0_9ACTN|nr:hypothetical protein [Nocardioides sp. WY-20]MDO7867519.1 hypothetical protein [Nocardioides sp. WY-20]
MRDAIGVFAPLLLFMLIPVLIPLAAITVGALVDRFAPSKPSPVQAAIEAALARTRASRESTRLHLAAQLQVGGRHTREQGAA